MADQQTDGCRGAEDEVTATPGRAVRDGIHRVSRRGTIIGATVVVLVFLALSEASLWQPDTLFTIAHNAQIGEAEAWWQGRTDIPERLWDTALKDGRVYSHFPPMFSILSAVVVPIFHGVPHVLIVLLLALPVPLLAYALFLRRVSSALWAVVLAIAFTFGTSMYPVLDKTIRGATPYFVNQTLSVIGLLLFLVAFYGRRWRLLLGGVGLVVAILSRQLTVVYALPFLWMAWRGDSGNSGGASGKRAGRVVAALGFMLLAVGIALTLNAIKFGHPLDSGYMHVYADRAEDAFSRDAKTYGLFSLHYLPRNLYYANIGPPRLHRIKIAGEEELHLRPNRHGTGIWWTTPLLLWLLIGARGVVSDERNRYLLLGAAAVFLGLMLYHSTGYEQRGFNRYSLDYVPALLAVVAPMCVQGRRRWISLAMIVWSVAYFRWLI